MRKALLILVCAVSLAYGGTKKFVVDLTTGETSTLMTRFFGGVPSTADYFAARGERVEIAVIIHGEAYKYFVKNLENTQYGVDEKLAADQETILAKLEAMRKKYAITLEVCQSGMHRKGILTQDLYPFVTPIPSAMIGLVKWQNEGYSYIPVH